MRNLQYFRGENKYQNEPMVELINALVQNPILGVPAAVLFLQGTYIANEIQEKQNPRRGLCAAIGFLWAIFWVVMVCLYKHKTIFINVEQVKDLIIPTVILSSFLLSLHLIYSIIRYEINRLINKRKRNNRIGKDNLFFK